MLKPTGRAQRTSAVCDKVIELTFFIITTRHPENVAYDPTDEAQPRRKPQPSIQNPT